MARQQRSKTKQSQRTQVQREIDESLREYEVDKLQRKRASLTKES